MKAKRKRNQYNIRISYSELKKITNKKLRNKLFYICDEWRLLRRQVLNKYKSSCMKCGLIGVMLHVDHIKPRSLFPWLELDFDNLQVLCERCNITKSNIGETDYRHQAAERKELIVTNFYHVEPVTCVSKKVYDRYNSYKSNQSNEVSPPKSVKPKKKKYIIIKRIDLANNNQSRKECLKNQT